MMRVSQPTKVVHRIPEMMVRVRATVDASPIRGWAVGNIGASITPMPIITAENTKTTKNIIGFAINPERYNLCIQRKIQANAL